MAWEEAMANKTFVHYDTATGEITAISNESEGHFYTRRARQEPIIEVPGPLNMKQYKVDLETMRVIPKEIVD
jgi:hypothetical protein